MVSNKEDVIINVIARLCGFILAVLLGGVVIITTWNSGLPCEHRIQAFSILIILGWSILLIRSKGWKAYGSIELAVAIVLFFYLGLFMGGVWHKGYLTNLPLIGINEETQGIHRDTLYHNAIASSINYYGYPSLLVNSAAFHNYHFGSHLVFGLLSKVLKVPTIFIYCYLYPIFLLPFYPSLILSVGKELRVHLGKQQKTTLIDIVVLLSFMTYLILPQTWSEKLGNYKTSWFVSESFCMAIILSLLYFKLMFVMIRRNLFDVRVFVIIFQMIVIPFFIIFISLTKISVGIIFAFAIAYFLFRKKKEVKYFLLELFYMAIVFAVHFIPALFYSPFLSGTTEDISMGI